MCISWTIRDCNYTVFVQMTDKLVTWKIKYRICTKSFTFPCDVLLALSLLLCPRARQLYRIQSLYPPGLTTRVTVFEDTIKRTSGKEGGRTNVSRINMTFLVLTGMNMNMGCDAV